WLCLAEWWRWPIGSNVCGRPDRKLVLGSSRSQQNCPARGACAARWRTARCCSRRAPHRAAALGGEFIACPWREWAVLTDKKTIPDDLLVREFTMVREVGGNA